MLFELVFTAFGLLVGFIAYEVLTVFVQNLLKHRELRKKSPYLAEVPGYSIFGGHTFSLAVSRKNMQIMQECYDRGLKFVRVLFKDWLMILTYDLDIIKRFIYDEPDAHPNRSNISISMDEIDNDSLLFAKDDQWRRIRQATAPAFTKLKVLQPNVMAEIEATISKFCEALERKVRASPDGQVIMDCDEKAVSYAVSLCFTCFYKKPDMVDFDAEHDRWTRICMQGVVEYANPIVGWLAVFPPLVKYLRPYITSRFHPYGIMYKKLFESITKMTRDNLEASKIDRDSKEAVTLNDGSKFRRNLIDYVIDRYHEGKLNTREYLHTSFLMFHAASKTTSDAVASLIVMLSRHPDAQEKLLEAVRAQGTESEYLDWFIFETLRLYPPIPGGCSRIIETDMVAKDGAFLPKGSTLVTPAHVIHRMKEYWGEDAHEFRPERWANSKSFHPCQFIAFGAGRRGCIGRDFALISTRSLLVSLVRKFKFAPAPEPADLDTRFTPFTIYLIYKKELNVKVSLR